MSKKDILTETEFHINVMVSTEHIEQAKTHDLLEFKKDKQASDFGRLIMDNKRWKHVEHDGAVTASQRLFIFTSNELKLFVDAEIKQKLKDLSERV